MIGIKEAVANAKANAKDLLGVSDLLLEEVESIPDYFLVTLSFPERGGWASITNPLLRQGPREFKQFKVDKETGEVVGMSIRQIA